MLTERLARNTRNAGRCELTIKIDPALHCGPCGALTVTVSVVEPLAGTVTLAGTVMRVSGELKVPALNTRGTVPPNVLGVNFVVETPNV